MVMRTLDLTLEGTTSLSRDTATGIKPPGEGKKDQREEVEIEGGSARGNRGMEKEQVGVKRRRTS
jgi:hypothetical protein